MKQPNQIHILPTPQNNDKQPSVTPNTQRTETQNEDGLGDIILIDN